MKQIVVSFSGGRTSAYLCSLIKKLYPDAVFVFMDTGAEHEATYEFIKQVNDFGDTLKDLAGSEGYLKGMIGKKESKVDAGADVQKDSRLTEYNKASMHFRGAMNVLRAIHSIRNNVGRGLVAINNGYDFLENTK